MTFSFNLLTYLSLCLSIDLVFTLRNPFKNPAIRATSYYVGSLFAAIIFTLIAAYSDYLPGSPATICVTLFTKTAFFVTVLPSLIYTFNSLRKPGLSKEYRSLVMKR
jgi:hypothetical protein